MSCFQYGLVFFGISLYMITSNSYQVPLEEKSRIQQQQQEQPQQQENREDDLGQAYYDVDSGIGLSDNLPAETFEDVIRILKDGKRRPDISPAAAAFRLRTTTTTPLLRPEKPASRSKVAIPEEQPVAKKNFPGLMDFDSDDEGDPSVVPVKPERLFSGLDHDAKPIENDARRIESDARRIESVAKLIQSDARPIRNEARRIENTKPIQNDARRIENDAKPVEYNARRIENDVDLNRHTPQPPPPPPQQQFASPSEMRKKYFGAIEDKKTEKKPSTADVVSDEDLKTLFINSGTGSSVMIPGCELVHFHVKSRCAGNLLELTLLSRNPLKGQVRLLEGDGQVSMEGTNLVVYGVLGPLSPSGNIWKLTKRVLQDDLVGECYNCENMNVRVVVKVGDATCGMAVSCQQKTSARLVPVAVEDSEKDRPSSSPLVKEPPSHPVPAAADPPIQDPGNTAKTTMMLMYGDSNPDMDGRAVTGMVPIGTRMSLVLSVFSRDVTLDLHVVKCQAKGDDGRGVLLVKDGCSVSNVIGEFREVLGIVQEASFGSHDVRRVSQFAEIRAFNFHRSPQNITLICTIKMCGGECTERPACVDSDINTMRSTRPAVPIFTQEVTLGKTFYVGGLPLEPTAEMLNLMLEMEPRKEQHPVIGEKYPDDCVSRKTLLIIVGILSAVYLGILLLCIYSVRRSAVRTAKEHIMEDYESPPKALYSEYSSPRRRTTPQTSPDHATFSINAEGYRSPIQQRSV